MRTADYDISSRLATSDSAYRGRITMEMMEPVSLPAIVVTNTDPCWFCQDEQPSDQEKNNENENPPSPEGKSETGVAENSETNNSSDLGEKLGKYVAAPGWSVLHKLDKEDPIPPGTSTAVVPGAHHLLPGNASVNKAAKLHKYML